MKIWEKLSSTIWLLNFDYLPDGNGKKVDAKNEKNDDDEKNWKNETDFWILHIKIWFYRNFHENLRKKMDQFLKTFLTNWGKNEN